MSTITTIAAGDNITDSRAVINTNFSNLNSDKIETSTLDTDTTLAANSDSKIATQKAVKAYVDAGGNVNASTTAKGIVEIATSAEVSAGTDTGGTGATLAVTPSQVSGLNRVRKVVTSGAVTAGTDDTAENAIFSQTITGGSLSTNNAIRVKIFVSNYSVQGSSPNLTLKFKYGGTTLGTLVLTNSGADVDLKGFIECYLVANASASAQTGVMQVTLIQDELGVVAIGSGTAVYTTGFVSGTATENSAGNLTLSVTYQWAATVTSGDDFDVSGYVVELIT